MIYSGCSAWETTVFKAVSARRPVFGWVRLVIIYLTYLALAGYAWGGVTGRDYRSPTEITNKGTVIPRYSEAWQLICSFESLWHSVYAASAGNSGGGGEKITDSEGKKTVIPWKTPGSSSRACSCSHPAARRILSSCCANPICSPLLAACVNGSPPTMEAITVNRWPACFDKSSISCASSVGSRKRFTVLRAIVSSNFLRSKLAPAVACSAFAMRSLDSICSLLADLAMKTPIATSPNTPRATIAPPLATREGIRKCRMDCQNSGPDSNNTPTTTINPNMIDQTSRAPNPSPIVGFLIGPFIRRPRSYEGRNVDRGAVCIVAAMGAMVLAVAWFLCARLS